MLFGNRLVGSGGQYQHGLGGVLQEVLPVVQEFTILCTDEVKRSAPAHSGQLTGRSILFSEHVVLVDDGQSTVDDG